MELTDAEVALLAAEAGAAVVRRMYRTPVAHHLKVGTDFATDADLQAETAIRDVLTEHLPGDSQLGEEHGASGPESPRRWLVDPLCGTRNFGAGLPLISTNVALSESGELTAAASAECVGDETYWTDGTTAWVRRNGVDSVLSPDTSNLMVAFNLEVDAGGRRRASEVMADPEFFETYQPRITSSTLALAWVAAGRHAAYVTEGDLRDNVHFAPGISLCRASGCVVTGLDGGPVDTGAGASSSPATSRASSLRSRSGRSVTADAVSERPRSGLIAAGDAATHAALLALMQE
jgi:myo-inositol-1(or 4)-monophosphatase